MRAILLSAVLLTGCAGTQTLKGYNNAEPEEVVVVEEDPEPIVNPWVLWGVTVVGLSLLTWHMFYTQRKDNLE